MLPSARRFSFLPLLLGASAAAVLLCGLTVRAAEETASFANAAVDPELSRIESILSTLYRSPHERKTDYDGWAEELINLLEREGDSPLAPLIYRKIWKIHSLCRIPAPLDRFFETFADRKISNGLLWQNALLDKRWALVKKGRHSEADALDALASYAGTALIIGPFGPGPGLFHDMVFPPEENLDVAARYPGLDRRGVEWRILSRSDRQAAFMPFRQFHPGGGCCYLLYQFRIPEAMPGLLVLSHTGSAKAWFNDVPVHDGDKRKKIVPPKQIIPLEFAAGWNRILVKLSRSDSQVQVSVTDRAGFPLGDLEENVEKVLHPVAGRSPLPASPPDLSAIRPLDFVESLLQRHPGNALLRTAAADLLARRGNLSGALEEARIAAKLDPRSAHAAFFLGRLHDLCSYLPDNFRSNRLREQFEKTAAIDPGFLPARLALARLDHMNDRSEDAIRELRAMLDENPGFYRAWVVLADIFESLGWKKEWHDAIVALERIAPARTLPKEMRALFHSSMGRNDLAIALLEKIVAMDRSRTDLIASLADKIMEQGDPARAASLYQEILDQGEDSVIREKSAAALTVAGRTEEAWSILEAACRRYPHRPEPLTALAAFLMKEGRGSDAVRLYELALRIDPSLGDVRALLAELGLQEYKDTLFSDYRKESAELMRSVPGKKEYPRASSIFVLDQMVTRVYPDGSSRSRIHQIYKILDEEAVEAYGRIQVPGRTEILRTITPDGNILLPTDAEEGTMFSMPGVEKGSLVEACFTIEQPHTPGTPMDLGRFTFQDADCTQPFLFSQFVVALPKTLAIDEDLTIPERFRGSDRFERTVVEKGDDVIHVFTARDMPVVERENFMPPDEEAFPNVVFATFRTWEEVAQIMANAHFPRIFPHVELKKKAGEIVAGAAGDRDRAERIYAFVNDLVKNDEGSDGALRVLLDRRGNRASLFMALLDAAGLEYDYLRCGIHAGFLESPRDWSKVATGLLPGELIRLHPRDEEGESVLVSMQSRATAFGDIPPLFFNATAMKVTGRTERLETIPGGDPEAVTELRIELKVRVEGKKAVITGRAWFPGYTRSNVQEGLRRLDRAQRRQFFEYQLLARSIHPGARVIDLEISGIDEPGAVPTFRFTIEADGFIQPAGTRMGSRLVPVPSNLTRAFIRKPTREFPLRFRGFNSYRFEMEVDLGGEYRIEHLPQSLVERCFFVNFSLLTSRTPKGFRVERALDLIPADLPPEDFPRLIEKLGGIDERELAPVLLQPAAAK